MGGWRLCRWVGRRGRSRRVLGLYGNFGGGSCTSVGIQTATLKIDGRRYPVVGEARVKVKVKVKVSSA